MTTFLFIFNIYLSACLYVLSVYLYQYAYTYVFKTKKITVLCDILLLHTAFFTCIYIINIYIYIYIYIEYDLLSLVES